jgi:predicted amidohydrolase
MHLFDADVEGLAHRESTWLAPGDEPWMESLATRSGVAFGLGVAICYDLRFPELFRTLSTRGAEVLALPAAFTAATGRDHWEVLVRARAIENLAFVIAANQCGSHDEQRASWGRSMIVGPWGEVLAAAEDQEGVVLARLDFDAMAAARRRLPALRNRRL